MRELEVSTYYTSLMVPLRLRNLGSQHIHIFSAMQKHHRAKTGFSKRGQAKGSEVHTCPSAARVEIAAVALRAQGVSLFFGAL